MERLTTDTKTGAALKLNNPRNEREAHEQLMKAYKVAIDRLAAYEATNRTPEELQRLVDLQERGLLVELPSKPNKIYWHRNIDSGLLELNIEMHELQKHDDKYPEIEYCAY